MGEKLERRLRELRQAEEKVSLGGGQEKIDKVHAKGKLTGRERIEMLMDPGSLVEFQKLIGHTTNTPGDGLIAGYGTIGGKTVCVYCQDPTVLGGSIGIAHGFKMHTTIERALQMRVPLIGLHDSPGARIPKLGDDWGRTEAAGGGSGDRHGGTVFYPNTLASGSIPQISVILGSCAGIAVYSPALTDFIFMVDKTSHLFITGPRTVKSIMGEDVDHETLGGANVHCTKSGVADLRFQTEAECFAAVKELLSYLPSSCDEKPPALDLGDDPDRTVQELETIVPDNPQRAYDVRKAIRAIVDQGEFFEIKPEFAPEICVGFARLDGKTVGVIANNSLYMAGSMTVDSSDKQARFIRFCDCFNIPFFSLVDTSAYLPGTDQEHRGIIRHGAKVLYALNESTVPSIAIIIRKAYGGGNLGMGVIPGSHTDFIYIWPIMEFGIMGAKQAVELMFGDEIAKSPDPEKTRREKTIIYEDTFINPVRNIASNPFYHNIIEPKDTRKALIQAFRLMENKLRASVNVPKKHGNIPL